MEPAGALNAIETVLRLAIVNVLGDDWLKAKGAPDKEELASRQHEESKRRDGTVTSNNLIDFTEFHHIKNIIEKNWDAFKIVFDNMGRTITFISVAEEAKRRTASYLDIVADVRNSVAHSRDLVPFERDLLSGIAGHFQNMVSIYRSGNEDSMNYYPKIEQVVDNFGITGAAGFAAGVTTGPRLDVGTRLTFTGSATNARGKPVKWQLLRTTADHPDVTGYYGTIEEVGEGDNIAIECQIGEEDVSERFWIVIRITTDSKWHRHQTGNRPYDDFVYFCYRVNPPYED